MAEYETSWYWFLLAGLIPIIGPLILWLAKKDENPDLAEVGKWLLIAEVVLLIPYIGWIIAIGLLLWRFSEEKESAYRGWYLFFAIPVIGFIAALLIDIPSEAKKDMAIVFAINLGIGILAALVAHSWLTSMIAHMPMGIHY